ncbi:MAG TPA: DUF6624 domain-containing protein [Bacteroidota bacterium]|nr:DUF6624 domain-containing protein [Bacteroidota bacterium]
MAEYVTSRGMRMTLSVMLASFSISAGQEVRNPSLRTDLLAHLKDDQDVRHVHFADKLQRGLKLDTSDARAINAVDSTNLRWIKLVILRYGWPGITLVGPDGEQAAFLLIQHADRDTAFQFQCLQLLQQAFSSGETTGEHLAMLTDRTEVAAGRPQIYGSQAFLLDGRIVFRPIRDSSTVDVKRLRLGLMPIMEYKSFLDSMYTSSGNKK